MYDGTTINGKFCQAIAFAEGCLHLNGSYNTNTLPYKLNNPGDLKATSSAYSHSMTSTGKLQFPDLGTGWNALAHQVELMFTNKSMVYKSSMSIQDVANHYSKEHDTPAEQTNADNWAKNVAAYLKCVTTTTLDELANMTKASPGLQANLDKLGVDQVGVSNVVQLPQVQQTTSSKWPGKQ
jgi:hypothetical protein